MSGKFVTFMLLFDGALSLDENFFPTYSGGKNRPIQVSKEINLKELKSKIPNCLKYDSSRFTVNIVCRMPMGSSFMATDVGDDEVCEVALRLATKQMLILYVEFEVISTENTLIGESSKLYLHYNCNDNMIEIGPSQGTMQHTDTVIELGHSRLPVHASCSPVRDDRVDEYETMSSSSSDDMIGMDDELSIPSDVVGDDEANIQEALIREYSMRNAMVQNEMNTNNEYVRTCKTTREWDDEMQADDLLTSNVHLLNEEVPDE